MSLYSLGAIPIDAAALRVVMPGYEWTPDVKDGGGLTFDTPPPFATTNRKWNEKRPENMKGRTVGRLKVVGYFGSRIRKAGQGGGAENQRWVCRCACGNYCIRNALTIKRAKDPDDCCIHCRHLNYLKRHDLFRQGVNE